MAFHLPMLCAVKTLAYRARCSRYSVTDMLGGCVEHTHCVTCDWRISAEGKPHSPNPNPKPNPKPPRPTSTHLHPAFTNLCQQRHILQICRVRLRLYTDSCGQVGEHWPRHTCPLRLYGRRSTGAGCRIRLVPHRLHTAGDQGEPGLRHVRRRRSGSILLSPANTSCAVNGA